MKANFIGSGAIERLAFICGTINGLLLKSGVTGCILYLFLAVASLTVTQPRSAQSSPPLP
jgi:hypothetical protein